MGHAATVEALDIKTVPAKMGPFWFQQPLDHFNKSETRTLKQRYWVNQQWYAKGGPVIFYNAGEAPADERSNFVLNSSMALVAQELQGVVVVLEHRMYGQSRPSDDKDLLNYLNTNQSLADMANIALSGNSLQNFPSGKMAPPDTKWVVYGGSYSGNLAAWLRLKYPNVFSAAIASSAPVQAGYDFYQYFDPIGNYGPSSCIKPMTSINGYVNQVLSGKNTAAKLKLKNQFGLGNLQDDDFASGKTRKKKKVGKRLVFFFLFLSLGSAEHSFGFLAVHVTHIQPIC
ncbi:hypothetical protein DM01DRAFT_1294103 [Hesseltinella vesiculosa]|uniref:Peptidase S28 n=1 Tax=Hesseltinella vesiculosa TaxID=101127 RepID=A0A1X2G675_9FUNG|nr:hypothetical protein DM01DRAFT_1294103 [Hesseltinella vesiculosa]